MRNNLMLMEPELTLDNLHQEFNDFLRNTFLESPFASQSYKGMLTLIPAIELKQTSKEYKVKVQLPGVNKEDINIDLTDDSLTISAETKQEKSENKETEAHEKIHTCEFRYGKYARTIHFANPIKTDGSSAEYKDGILSIVIPKQKVEKATTKRLTIK